MLYEFLRTEAEYQDALVRAEKLTGAQPGTELGDELAALLDLIYTYEEEHFPED